MTQEPDNDALDGSREWKGTLVEENYTDPVYDPAEVGRLGDDVSDTTFKTMGLISSDPRTYGREVLPQLRQR